MKIPPNTEIFKTPITTSWLGPDNILYSISHPGERSIANFIPMFEVYRKLSQNGARKLCIIADFTDAQPLNKDVRDYMNAELSKYVRALAIISSTLHGKTLGNIFKELQSAHYPIRVFDKLDHAREWISEFSQNLPNDPRY